MQTAVGVLAKGDEVEIKWIDAPNARERQNFYPAQVIWRRITMHD